MSLRLVRVRAVHPRGCGEHIQLFGNDINFIGSSPRVRGTLLYPPTSGGRPRFIPAGAGNTGLPARIPARRSVHPRGCGEHGAPSSDPRQALGSSPRVRGTPQRGEADCLTGRFIPAGAGNTFPGRRIKRGQEVHPRGCGEHSLPLGVKSSVGGSSPRVRGTLTLAFAGTFKTLVHPRGCGEHCGLVAGRACSAGSSPRVRGTHSPDGE